MACAGCNREVSALDPIVIVLLDKVAVGVMRDLRPHRQRCSLGYCVQRSPGTRNLQIK
jgi:hypothetical protein